MKRISVALLVAIALLDSGCSCLTSRGRQEAAYARYVRRSSAGRIKMQRKLASLPKIPASHPVTEPEMNGSAGPESVTASNE